MFQTITDITEGTDLQQYIDNRDGLLLVNLRSITLTIGWYNTVTDEGFGYLKKGKVVAVKLPRGLWSFNDLQEFINTEFTDFAAIDICRANGLITLIVKHEKITMSPGMCDILGINKIYNANKGWLEPGTYIGDKPVDFALTKTLRVHLNQLNTSDNIYNGAPSTLLKIVNASNSSFGESITIEYPQPEFKRLERSCITGLNITVKDDKGRTLDNHGYPISVVLEINEYIRA